MLNLNPTVLELVVGHEHRSRIRAAEKRRIIAECVHAPGEVAGGLGSIRSFILGRRGVDGRGRA